MATSESGGDQLHLTAYSQNLREHAGSMQTSGIRGTLYEIAHECLLIGNGENVL